MAVVKRLVVEVLESSILMVIMKETEMETETEMVIVIRMEVTAGAGGGK